LVSSTFNESRQKDLIRFVLKIYSGDLSRTVGYIVCDVDGAGFIRIMEKYLSSDRQIVWLQPSGDRPALRVGKPLSQQTSAYDVATRKMLSGSWSASDSRVYGKDVLLDVPQEKYNLAAFSLTPQYLLEENQRILTRNMLLAALIVIAVAVISAILITRSLTTPLTHIVQALTRIRNGETELRLTGLKSDEIGVLGETINDMLDRIQQLIAQVYSAKLLLKQAEYKALQAQVDPHFLYNTLDTMGSIAASQQCHTVSTLCQAMSNIFRYCIDMQDPLSTVGNEIVHLKNYMYVMNVRMQNSVVLDINVDRSLLSEKIPRLAVQPVVENALHHGLRNKAGDKHITIEGKRENGVVVLEVSDNGVGMDAIHVNHLLESGGTLERSSSIGLGNIHARIKLLFGDQYGVQVRSVPGAGSTVALRVPSTCPEGGTS
ncbi:MAG TPA: sensor histidine kinase, partial [Spirochaetia bacterium]|nr:sensor histidine kinase [Spirochaetia bacterium]